MPPPHPRSHRAVPVAMKWGQAHVSVGQERGVRGCWRGDEGRKAGEQKPPDWLATGGCWQGSRSRIWGRGKSKEMNSARSTRLGIVVNRHCSLEQLVSSPPCLAGWGVLATAGMSLSRALHCTTGSLLTKGL